MAIEREVYIDARQAARFAGLSLVAWWKAVREGLMPAPVYPLRRAPRWRPNEIREAQTKARALLLGKNVLVRSEKLAATK